MTSAEIEVATADPEGQANVAQLLVKSGWPEAVARQAVEKAYGLLRTSPPPCPTQMYDRICEAPHRYAAEYGAVRAKVDDVRVRLHCIADETKTAITMMTELRDTEAHKVLGYPSWTALVADEFGDALKQLDQALRKPVIRELADTGMSTRAIAKVVGVNQSTVSRDLAAGDATASPETTTLSVVREDGPSLADRPVTGLDGKTYRKPGPSWVDAYREAAQSGQMQCPTPRRKSLPDAYRAAVWDLEKAVERLVRLHADDRFGKHRESVEVKWRALNAMGSLLSDLEDDLSGRERLHCSNCGEQRPPDRNHNTTCATCRETD